MYFDKHLLTFLPYPSKISRRCYSLWMGLNCRKSGKQCRPWSNTAFCSIWSGSELCSGLSVIIQRVNNPGSTLGDINVYWELSALDCSMITFTGINLQWEELSAHDYHNNYICSYRSAFRFVCTWQDRGNIVHSFWEIDNAWSPCLM